MTLTNVYKSGTMSVLCSQGIWIYSGLEDDVLDEDRFSTLSPNKGVALGVVGELPCASEFSLVAWTTNPWAEVRSEGCVSSEVLGGVGFSFETASASLFAS